VVQSSKIDAGSRRERISGIWGAAAPQAFMAPIRYTRMTAKRRTGAP
jgi:hypothetical protein